MGVLDYARKGFRGRSLSAGRQGSSLYGYSYSAPGGLDWHKEAGVRYDTSIVYAAVQFATDAMLEVDVYVRRPNGTDPQGNTVYKEVKDHPVTLLLRDPNPWYGYGPLMSGWVISELTGIGGQSYTYKHRDKGRVVALEYIPHFRCRPRWGEKNDGAFVDYYQMTMQSGVERVPPQDMLVQRFGPINPLRVQYSVGPLEACLLEVVTDKQAAAYTAALLFNAGVTPHLISPAVKDTDGDQIVFGPEQRAQLQEAWDDKITGDNRGRPLVSPMPIKVDDLSLDPTTMNLEGIRNINEERICAALRIPPQVLHLGTGLENQNNRASAEAAAAAAARGFTKPYMLKKGRELTRDLIPELGEEGEEVCFRWQDIEGLQENGSERAKRLQTACGGPWMTVDEVRKDDGLDPLPGGEGSKMRSGKQDGNDGDEDQDAKRSARNGKPARV